jgi:hypothetical protein
MLCYEVWVNGERVCVAGAEGMSGMQALLARPGDGNAALFLVSGDTVPSKTLRETYEWLGRELHANDEVRIRLVESDSPDRPESVKSFGTKKEETGTKKVFCSFCGQGQDETKKIVAGFQANVCSECFELLGEIFNEKA